MNHASTEALAVGGFTVGQVLSLVHTGLGCLVLLATLGYTLTKWALLLFDRIRQKRTLNRSEK